MLKGNRWIIDRNIVSVNPGNVESQDTTQAGKHWSLFPRYCDVLYHEGTDYWDRLLTCGPASVVWFVGSSARTCFRVSVYFLPYLSHPSSHLFSFLRHSASCHVVQFVWIKQDALVAPIWRWHSRAERHTLQPTSSAELHRGTGLALSQAQMYCEQFGSSTCERS